MGFKVKNVFKNISKDVGQAVKATSKGDFKGMAKNFAELGAGAMTFGSTYVLEEAFKKQFGNEPTPEEVAAQATLAPEDPNAIMQKQLEEEKKRRLRTPGRAQYSLSSRSNLPSLIGDNSVLGQNSLY